MDYIARKPRLMDHEVTLEVLADQEPTKGQSFKCLQLANLHSMAVDFAKTGAPAEMPRILKPREYPDFLERTDQPMYTSPGILVDAENHESLYAE
ncbi:hypothetical protein MRB53_023701 [Persea americana]|uniref:Uncharacterized protein n=1 Tax=Persea americana TaxID=3435 RepID=A0ACC2LB54_PERAE|nr:hypothetical protein MRB53_023701 [Persea americana]